MENQWTEAMRLYVDNNNYAYDCVQGKLSELTNDNADYDLAVDTLSDYLEEIYDDACTCDPESFSLLSDIIDLAKDEVDFTAIARDYIEDNN